MEFKIQVARLRHALALLEPVSKNASIPILKYVRLGDGRVAASDLENTVLVELPEIREVEGACLLPYGAVRDLLRFTPGSAMMTLVPRGGKVHLYVQGTQASFATKDAVDYPSLPKIGEGAMGSLVDGDDLVNTLASLWEYAAQGKDRPVLTAVCLTLEEPMEAAAADGIRLAIRTLRCGFHGGEGRRVLVPADTARVLQKLWKLAPPPSEAPEGSPIAEVVVARRPIWMEYDQAGALMQFRFGDVTVVSKAIEGTYPNYRQLVPTSHTGRATVFGADLARAVCQVGFVVSEGAGIVGLSWEGEVMTVKGSAVDVGDVEVAIKAQVEAPAHIAFNKRYLLDYLRDKDGPVDISVTTPSSPGLLTYQGVSVVIMPMMAKDDQLAATQDKEPPAAEGASTGTDEAPADMDEVAAEAGVSTEVEEAPTEETPDTHEPEVTAEEAVKKAKPKRRRRKKQE